MSDIEKSVATGSHFLATFCRSINCISLMSLNYKTYFRHFLNLKHLLYLRAFNLFSFKKSSVLTTEYVFSFFWYKSKLFNSGPQVVHFSSDRLRLFEQC